MELQQRVRQYIEQHDLFAPDSRVVVALSGGSDSVALASVLCDLDAAGALKLVGLAHFNHQLRRAAGEDERFCVRLAAALGRPILVEGEDVTARSRRDRQSVETAARAARHGFFERARRHFGAHVVALGHTRDDQAETVLLRLVRGAGLRGLSAMHPRHGALVRPLLSCRRAELRDYLAARRLAFVEDESNADVSIPRNRVRAELMPVLQARFNPRIVDTLAAEAQLAQDMLSWIEAEADKLLVRARHPATGGLDIEALQTAPSALTRFAVWRALNEAAGGRPVSYDHVEMALAVMRSPASSSRDLPGQRVERVGAALVLRSRAVGASGRVLAKAPNFFEYPLSIPGEVVLPAVGATLIAERRPALPGGSESVGPDRPGEPTAVVRDDLADGTWRVRSRCPGDWFQPVGLGGRKKLQDLFVDRKVPRDRRDLIPLVVSGSGRIVWVAGYGIDEAFRVTDPAQHVVVL